MSMTMADSSLKSRGILESKSWERLPNEVLESIFSFLDGRSIGRAHAVCRQWNSVINHMSTGSLLWFNCCKSEILKYTLLHLCNHPMEAHHRTSLEWKDVYVRWCTCRGRRRFCEDDARLDVKKVVQRSPGEIQHQALLRYVCFTDDLVFVLENEFLVVYDMHSDASMREQLDRDETYRCCPVSTTTVLMTTLGIHMPVDKRGKTDFQIAVASTPLVVGTAFCLRIYVGLQCICSVRSSQLVKQVSMCSWYDIILLDSQFADGVSVYRFNMDSTTAQNNYDLREECILRLPELCGNPYSPEISATIIGDRILTLSDKCLTVWNAETAEILSCVEQPHYSVPGFNGRRDQTISWVGGIVATAQTITGDLPVVLLYKLDDNCANIEKVTWLQHGIYPQSLRVLYDDSLWVINEGGSELLLRMENSGASGKSNRTPQPTEIKGHIPAICQPDRNALSTPESNGDSSLLLASDGTDISTPGCSRTELSNPVYNTTDVPSSHDHNRTGISTQDHSRIEKLTATGGALLKIEISRLSSLEYSDNSREHYTSDKIVPDVTDIIAEHSREEYGGVTADMLNYWESQESRDLGCREASDEDVSLSTAGKTEEDAYRQSLSQLLGIGEDSSLWQNYSEGAHHPMSGAELQNIEEHFQADDEDHNSEEDEDDGDNEEDKDDDEEHCVGQGEESGDDCCSLDNCDQPLSKGDRLGTTGKLYLTIRNDYTPNVVDIPPVEGVTLTQEDIERPEQRPLDVRISHQGCEMIACRFAFTDYAVAMVSLCHSPCRDIFVLYK